MHSDAIRSSWLDPVERLRKISELIRSREGVFLDLGCGSGFILLRLSDKFHSSIGLDISSSGLREIRKQDKRPNLVLGDAENTPFRDSSIDRVVCTEVIEHLYKPRKCLGEIKRVVKKGESVVITTPNRQNISLILTRFLEKLGYNEPSHQIIENHFSAKEIRRIIDELNFRVEIHEGIYFIPSPLLHLLPKWFKFRIVFLQRRFESFSFSKYVGLYQVILAYS